MPAHHGKYVSYYRVSTDKQGKSGLGLDAQKAAVANRLNGGRWQIVGEFVEVESGKRASRPQLDAAIAACKKHKAKLIVAKLDRLSRNVSFLLKLIGWRGGSLCRSPQTQRNGQVCADHDGERCRA